MSEQRRRQETFWHTLRGLVREAGDLTIATRLGVFRSTAAGQFRANVSPVLVIDGGVENSNGGVDDSNG